ncbi:MAG TPA: hypothetical protein VHP37_03090 [Burkholderiales bacterium]|nr:hypothetical protein [Burkholderiales bacterium]
MSESYAADALALERQLRSACIAALYGKHSGQLDAVSRARLQRRIANAETRIVLLETRYLNQPL